MGNIVVRIPNHLGDTLMAQPAVRALAEHHPGGSLHLLLPEWAVPIYEGIDDVSLLRLDRRYLHGPGGIKHQVGLLRANNFEAGILLTPSFSSALAFYLAGVKYRYGYRSDYRSLLINRGFALSDDSAVHRSERYVRLVERFTGGNIRTGPPRISVNRRAVEKAAAFLADRGVDPESDFIVMAPQAVAESRRWGSENYGRLAVRLIRQYGCRVILLGTKDEKQAGEEVAGRSEGIINTCGETDIESAAAVLSKAGLFIGNDSGPAHLAAAVDIPLVVLSGADRPSETSPISDKKTVIIKSNLDCISCVKNRCPQKGEAFMQCMKQITIDEVHDATGKYL
jgi:lipopolysaccharide heptosyltransferase II